MACLKKIFLVQPSIHLRFKLCKSMKNQDKLAEQEHTSKSKPKNKLLI